MYSDTFVRIGSLLVHTLTCLAVTGDFSRNYNRRTVSGGNGHVTVSGKGRRLIVLNFKEYSYIAKVSAHL